MADAETTLLVSAFQNPDLSGCYRKGSTARW